MLFDFSKGETMHPAKLVIPVLLLPRCGPGSGRRPASALPSKAARRGRAYNWSGDLRWPARDAPGGYCSTAGSLVTSTLSTRLTSMSTTSTR
jgi:hypothetical protein